MALIKRRAAKSPQQWVLTLTVAVALIFFITSILDVKTALNNITAENPEWGNIIQGSIDGKEIATQIFAIFITGAVVYLAMFIVTGIAGPWNKKKFMTFLLLGVAVYVISAYVLPELGFEMPTLFETAAVLQYNVAPQTLIPIP